MSSLILMLTQLCSLQLVSFFTPNGPLQTSFPREFQLNFTHHICSLHMLIFPVFCLHSTERNPFLFKNYIFSMLWQQIMFSLNICNIPFMFKNPEEEIFPGYAFIKLTDDIHQKLREQRTLLKEIVFDKHFYSSKLYCVFQSGICISTCVLKTHILF